MPAYAYKDGKGNEIVREFPRGTAPETIGKFRRVYSFPQVIFKGTGWAGKKENFKVSWDEVEKITKESDRMAKENEDKQRANLKNVLLDSI